MDRTFCIGTAHEKMRQGQKVSHEYFTPKEYYYMQHGRIIAEDGVNHTAEFNRKKQLEAFKQGWRIWEEPKS